MVACSDMLVCRAGGVVGMHPAGLGAVIWAPAVYAVDSLCSAFESHVALFSTSETCRTVSVV